MAITTGGTASGGLTQEQVAALTPQQSGFQLDPDFGQFLLPLLFSSFGGVGTLLAQLFGGVLNNRQIEAASQRDLARTEEGIGILEDTQGRVDFDTTINRTPFGQPFTFGGIQFGGDPRGPNKDTFGKPGSPFTPSPAGAGQSLDLNEQFTSAQTFEEGLPSDIHDPISFDPVDPRNFSFDPSEIRALGERLGGDLRSGATDFGTLLGESGVEGLTERVAERFPDFSAFQGERLGDIAEAARGIEQQARQETAGQFGSLEEGQGELQRRQFANRLSAGQAGSAVASQVEGLKTELAKFLGGVEQGEVATRRGISQDVLSDTLSRDLGAAEIEGTLFGQGEAIRGQNLRDLGGIAQFNTAMQSDIDRFNKTFPVDLAAQGAQFTGQDETQAFNAFMNMILPILGVSQGAAGLDVDLSKSIAGLLTGFEEVIGQTDPSIIPAFFNQQRAEDAAKDAERDARNLRIQGNFDPGGRLLSNFGGGGSS